MKKSNENFDELFASIKVRIISREKLAAEFTKELSTPVKPMGSVAVVTNTKGMIGVFDSECIGTIQLPDNKEEYPFAFDLFPDVKGKIFIFPTKGIGLSVDEMKKLTDEQGVDGNLKDFMGDRYCYNGRIEGNMYEFKGWYVKGK